MWRELFACWAPCFKFPHPVSYESFFGRPIMWRTTYFLMSIHVLVTLTITAPILFIYVAVWLLPTSPCKVMHIDPCLIEKIYVWRSPLYIMWDSMVNTVTSRMTLLINKWTNVVMDDGWVHSLAKTLRFLVQQHVAKHCRGWFGVWMKYQLVSDGNCNIVNL